MPLDWRSWTRKALAGFLFHGQVLQLLPRAVSGRRFIVAYHRVIPDDSGDLSFVQPGMYVTSDTFEMHLHHLQARYAVVPLEQLVAMQDGDACAITFDDGWRDNYATAFPLLRQHGLPATVFLATNLVGTARWPWPDRVCFYVHLAAPADLSAVLEPAWREEVGTSFGTSVPSGDRFAAAEEIVHRLKRLGHDVLTRVVGRLDDRFTDLDVALHQQRPWLTWEEAREMAEHGISFGSHTENHVILTKVPLLEARHEIIHSRTELSTRLGQPVTAFCYPNGAYNPDIVRMVAEAGYQCAVTTKSGSLQCPARPFELNRILVHNDISSTQAMFACALAGLGNLRQLWPGRDRQGR